MSQSSLTPERFAELRSRFGSTSSWAIWVTTGETPKSGAGDLSMFDDPELLSKLRTEYVFVGLSCTGSQLEFLETDRPWYAFHSDAPSQNVYKLRYALTGTKYWGSYLTDVIKDFPETNAGKVYAYLKQHSVFLESNIERLECELNLLGGKPVLAALGSQVYSILQKTLADRYPVVKLVHFSHFIGKEKYREKVLAALEKYETVKDDSICEL